jgi:hypothetical protein
MDILIPWSLLPLFLFASWLSSVNTHLSQTLCCQYVLSHTDLKAMDPPTMDPNYEPKETFLQVRFFHFVTKTESWQTVISILVSSPISIHY